MTAYGYIGTSRDQEPGQPGSAPDVQRRQLVEVGVDLAHIYSGVAVSGVSMASAKHTGWALECCTTQVMRGGFNIAGGKVDQRRL